MPGSPSSGSLDAVPRADEQGIDEVARVEARLPDELAKGVGSAETPEPGRGKRGHDLHLSSCDLPGAG